MVRRQFLQVVEPEERQLREHSALLRNSGRQNVVERRDAVSGNDEQVFAQAIHVADFTLRMPFHARDVAFKENTSGDEIHEDLPVYIGGVNDDDSVLRGFVNRRTY